MIPYILVATFLWLVTLGTLESRSNAGWSLLCLIVMIAFTGLRYDLGYDWLAYEQYFDWVRPYFSWENYKINQSIIPVEYLYFLLNVFIKFIGGDFELLLFVISVFNLIVIDRMANSIDPNSRPFLWMLYLCLALIMVQFNILRQSLASSFVIISLLFLCEKKRAYSSISGICALGFHTSVAMFLPIIPFIHRNIKINYIIAIIFISGIIFLFGNIFLSTTLSAVSSLLPGGFSSKVDGYATGIAGQNVWGISPLAAILILMYIFLLFILLKLPRNPHVNVAILLTIAILVAHIAFGQVPIIWNRVMCVSLPWQLAVFWKYYIKRLSPEVRTLGVGFGGLAAIMVFSFQLTREENIAFVPYHSLAQVWLFGDEGDGRVRSMYAVQQGQIEAAQRASQ